MAGQVLNHVRVPLCQRTEKIQDRITLSKGPLHFFSALLCSAPPYVSALAVTFYLARFTALDLKFGFKSQRTRSPSEIFELRGKQLSDSICEVNRSFYELPRLGTEPLRNDPTFATDLVWFVIAGFCVSAGNMI